MPMLASQLPPHGAHAALPRNRTAAVTGPPYGAICQCCARISKLGPLFGSTAMNG